MKRGRLWLTTGFLVAGIGMYGFTQYAALQPQSIQAQGLPSPGSSPAFIVKDNQVGSLGRVEPQGQVITVGGPSGERIGELLVRESQKVKQGSILVRLENYPERLAERNYAAAQLSEAQARLQANLQLSTVKVREARTRLQQVDQPKVMEIEAQTATIRQLQAELKDAETNQRRFQDLFAQGAIAQQELDNRTLAVRQKQEELRNAQATLRKWEVTRGTDLINAQAQVQTAEADRISVESQSSIASLTRNLELANARLERTLIRAPQDGQILKIRRYPGEVIDSSQGILQMGNTQQMYVVAEVYETDIPKIRLGQRATITSAAFSKPIQGTVDHVGLQIGKKDVLSTNPAEDVDARVVEVKIRLDPQDSPQAAGLTNIQVTVEIHLQNSAG